MKFAGRPEKRHSQPNLKSRYLKYKKKAFIKGAQLWPSYTSPTEPLPEIISREMYCLAFHSAAKSGRRREGRMRVEEEEEEAGVKKKRQEKPVLIQTM